MAPPQFSRRRRRWVPRPKAIVRCFTDEAIGRGLRAVLDRHLLAYADDAALERALAIFLDAATPTTAEAWPARHPMTCARCGRTITDVHGVALVEILISESLWRCVRCASAVH